MNDSSSFLMRGDDGQLYRLTGKQLAAFKVPSGDPAHSAVPAFPQPAQASSAPKMDLVCLFVQKEK
jgi:hypothetical protein